MPILITHLTHSQGSLDDILSSEDLKLDWNFKFSLLKDICRGMTYLSGTHIKSHGRLKSSNCVVDNRWTLKITGKVTIRLQESLILSRGYTSVVIFDSSFYNFIQRGSSTVGEPHYTGLPHETYHLISSPSFQTMECIFSSQTSTVFQSSPPTRTALLRRPRKASRTASSLPSSTPLLRSYALEWPILTTWALAPSRETCIGRRGKWKGACFAKYSFFWESPYSTQLQGLENS